MASDQTRSFVTMSSANDPLRRLLNPILNIFLSSTLRFLLALLLLVSCCMCIAISLLSDLPPVFLIPLVVLNVTILLHHWYVMTK